MTPKEVLQAGSFGGTYFRPIKSSVTNWKYDKMWLELPQNWLEGLNVAKMVASEIYDEKVNKYQGISEVTSDTHSPTQILDQ